MMSSSLRNATQSYIWDGDGSLPWILLHHDAGAFWTDRATSDYATTGGQKTPGVGTEDFPILCSCGVLIAHVAIFRPTWFTFELVVNTSLWTIGLCRFRFASASTYPS